MSNRPLTSVGIEIEVNALPHELRDSINWDVWEQAHEHCGVELRSSPCAGIGDLRRLKKSIRSMSKSAGAKLCGFSNAGTHIHIDFLKSKKKGENGALIRKAAPIGKSVYDGGPIYINPTGSGKKWYWEDEKGKLYRSPSAYYKSKGEGRRSRDIYVDTGANAHTLLAVKRFMAIGIRFADVLFAIQHPDRRFNKYCHTLEDWNEDLLFEQPTIYNIAAHQNLQQNHRRHMFNVMAFQKWGTVEVRMLKASLNTDEIWAQLMLFNRLARLARTNTPLPKPCGLITKDFTTLINFAGMHGKYRDILVKMMGRSLRTKDFKCFCYKCYGEYRQSEMFDYGLSRAVCRHCHEVAECFACRRGLNRLNLTNKSKVDDAIEGGRWTCKSCMENNQFEYTLDREKTTSSVLALDAWVGSGYDDLGMRQLRRMRAIFS